MRCPSCCNSVYLTAPFATLSSLVIEWVEVFNIISGEEQVDKSGNHQDVNNPLFHLDGLDHLFIQMMQSSIELMNLRNPIHARSPMLLIFRLSVSARLVRI